MSFNSNVIFEGSGITGTGSPTITFDGTVEGPTVKLFYSMTVIMASLCHDVKPEWWGAVRDGVTDDTIPIKAMFASGAGSCFFTAGTYLVVGDPLTPAPTVLIIRADGQVQDGPTTYVHFGLTSLTANSQVKADLIEALSTIIAGTSIVAGEQVEAGTYLQAQAGTSTVNFKAGGRIFRYNNATGIPTVGIVATNLVSATLKTGTLLNVGDAIRVRGGGTSTANQTVTVAVFIGATQVFSAIAGGVFDSSSWFFEVEIVLTDTGKVTALGWFSFTEDNSPAVNQEIAVGQELETTVILTGDPLIQIKGTSSNNIFTQKTMTVDFIPAPI
jgi:hypothetical protein